MCERADFLQVLDTLLQPERFRDYGPNGLQVEGRARVGKIVSGVTASRALIEAAIAAGADTILVHHGLFWRGQDGRVTGWMKQRLALLLAHDINLFAYHLPLDAHPSLGNNAQWRSPGLVNRTWVAWGSVLMARSLNQRRRWRRISSLRWDARWYWQVTGIRRFERLHGAAVARKAILRQPSLQAPTHLSRVRSLSRKRTMRVNAVWPTWLVATTP
ncbi:MAG: hypothetical protein RLZZ371_879, partial [Pseudomonadota bacterium]